MLVIIGNGFDLSLGLPTKWSDFLKSSQFRIRNSPGRNLDLFAHLEKQQTLQKWVDVENELEVYAQEISSKPNNKDDIQKFKRDFELLNSNLRLYFYDNKIGENIHSWSETNAGKLIQAIKEESQTFSKNITIVDFNYTNTFSTLIKENEYLKSSIDIKNIHGKYTDNNIIFGYENPNNSLSARDFGLIKKSYRNNYAGGDFKDQLESNNEFIIFGHSLGNSDHQYFQDFFESLINKEIPVSIKIFYYKNQNDINAEIDDMVNGKLHELKNNTNIRLEYFNSAEVLSKNDFTFNY